MINSPINPDKLLVVALEAAKSAVTIITAAADLPKQVSYKGRTDLVTETDKKSEIAITHLIRDAFPEHQILAEESGQDSRESDYLWLIDPLDGTTNFVHGYPSYGVSIAVHYKSQPLCGVIVELPANNLYHAVAGSGAFCNGIPIRVSGVSKIEQSLLVTGFGYEHGELWQQNMKLFKHFTDISQGVRRLGAAAVDLAHVACGRVDGYWEFDIKPWDSGAGILLVKEAGGKISRMNGNDYSIFDNQILASNNILHATLSSHILSELD